MTLLAFLAVIVVVGAWLGIRAAEANQVQRDLTAYLVSIPADEWREQ